VCLVGSRINLGPEPSRTGALCGERALGGGEHHRAAGGGERQRMSASPDRQPGAWKNDGVRGLAIIAILAALSSACGLTQPRKATIARTAGAAGVIAGGAAAAVVIHDRRSSDIALQVGGGTAAGLIPAALLDSISHQSDPSPTTPGEIYSSIGSGLGKGFLVSLTVLVPSFVTWKIGESQEESASPGYAFLGATLGAIGGTMVGSLLVDSGLPAWARIAISASLFGSLTTLGYQLGGGGRP
jgi:hypothetical protein